MIDTPNRRDMMKLVGGGIAAMAVMPSVLKANCTLSPLKGPLTGGGCFTSPVYTRYSVPQLDYSRSSHVVATQALFNGTVTQQKVNDVITSMGQLASNLQSTGVHEQWRNDATNAYPVLIQQPDSTMMGAVESARAYYLPQVPDSSAAATVNYAMQQAPGNDYNWAYESIYNPNGVAGLLNTWGNAVQNIQAASQSTYYWCGSPAEIQQTMTDISTMSQLAAILLALGGAGTPAYYLGRAMGGMAVGLGYLLTLCT